MDQCTFEQCLRDLESNDQARRRKGIQRLANFADRRALQVSKALLSDQDEMIRFYAHQTYTQLIEKGINPRESKESEKKKEYQYLFNPLQVLDEVLFIFKANLGHNIYASLKTGWIKIVLFAGVFHLMRQMNYYLRWEQFLSLPLLGTLFLYSIVIRPLVWMSVGKSFLGGYQDRKARNLSKQPFSLNQYCSLATVNFFKSLLVVLFPGLLFLGGKNQPLLNLAGILVFIYSLYKTAYLMPLQLMKTRPAGQTVSIALARYSRYGKIFKRLYPSFFLIAGSFYVCIGLGAITTWNIWFKSGMFEQGFLLLLADILIEPYWIGFQILTTRCIMQMEAERIVRTTS